MLAGDRSLRLAVLFRGLLLLALWCAGDEAAKSHVFITYDSCSDEIVCSYKENVDGECYIEYSDEDETQNVTIKLNSAISPRYSLMLGNTYQYRAIITTESTIELLILRGNFTPGECEECDEPRTTKANAALISLGVVMWVMSLTGALVLLIFHLKFINEKHIKTHRFSRKLGVCGAVVLLLALILWIATGPVIIGETDFCNSRWKQSRDSVVAFSFLLSLASLVLYVIALILLGISFRHVIPMIKRHPSIFRREEIVMEQSGKYSSPEDFTVKANPVFGYDLSSSTDSSKMDSSPSVDVVGITNLHASELTDSNTSDTGVVNTAVKKFTDASIIGNKYAS